MYDMQSEIILELAEKGDCIIVGRCADHVLESKHVDCLSLFICAPFDWRVHHRMEIENVDEKTAAALVEKTDKQPGEILHPLYRPPVGPAGKL